MTTTTTPPDLRALALDSLDRLLDSAAAPGLAVACGRLAKGGCR
jgi:hypothetical protein